MFSQESVMVQVLFSISDIVFCFNELKTNNNRILYKNKNPHSWENTGFTYNNLMFRSYHQLLALRNWIAASIEP